MGPAGPPIGAAGPLPVFYGHGWGRCWPPHTPWVTAGTREGRFGAWGGAGYTAGPQVALGCLLLGTWLSVVRTFWAGKNPLPFPPEAGATRTTQGHGAPQGPLSAAPQRHRHTWSEQ